MAYVYATLIIKEKYNYSDLPSKMKEQVKAILIDLGCEQYITE